MFSVKGGGAGETVCAVSLASSVSGRGGSPAPKKESVGRDSERVRKKCWKKIPLGRQRQDVSFDAATKVRREP
ncbi:hypothetical protein BDV28DRAFT_144579 [Aspergillus coremiiformis]|uniref:Uncharacterized protein n=1 Tax=Aspergillus coremiiformis TaxID=138285 RepID=A0A5N6YWD1_9EURO|nr:hypothetical protein BDV28DRAFT_144579 [Aspergillus coremiiformis]